MRGKDICTYSKCTGCFACANICPKNCITLKNDKYGEIHPVVDQNLCIDCKICQKTCPNNRCFEFKYPKKCYAAWITDTEKRKICASGGIGTEFSEYVIKQGGVIFGSRYDENLNPIITWTNLLSELKHFKGSRYVQSKIGNETYKQVKKFLLTGRLVLFIATPCQIAGLYGFLKKSYENLITVDLICHGVSPTIYFQQEISYLKQKYSLLDIADARFRGNDGNNFCLTLWNEARQKLFPRNNYLQKIFQTDEKEQYYIKGFLTGTSLRENCYTCSYARPERISDLTIGDFIGLGAKMPFIYSKGNVSSITTNTQKGYGFLMKVSKDNNELKIVERDYKERLAYRPSLMEPFKRDERNAEFRKQFTLFGFPQAIRLVFGNEIKKEYHSMLLHRLYPNHIAKLCIMRILGKTGIIWVKKLLNKQA